MDKTTGNGARLALCFALSWATVGCGELQTDGDSSENLALSARAGRVGDPDCGRIHDPRTDRDHAFHKRCERYQQRHRRGAGKAGNASLSTRALMDSQRLTQVEATTGTFDDDAVAPGKLDELRVEVARSSRKGHDDRVIVVKDGRQGGYARVSIPGLVHGQSMKVTGRISGIDRGVDQVSVDDLVEYRPDLAVGTISVPAAPAVGVPTSIAATIRELMGDEGAKADCVLAVDGATVDRANGIWVDSGSVVTCHFEYTFSTAGAHQVAVNVTNVAPGDYDSSNNHAEIGVAAASQFTFSGSAYDSSYSGEDVEDVIDGSGAVLYHRVDTWNGANQSAMVTGTWPASVTFPLASVSVTAASGGASWSLVSLTGVAADASDGSGSTCASGNDDTGYNWIGICTQAADGGPTTQISISAFAGEVTYHSLGACLATSDFYDCASGYTWNSGSDAQPSSRHPFIGGVTFGLTVTDASGASLHAAPAIPLARFTSADEDPRTCEPQPDGVQHCFSHKYGETGVSGSVGQ